MNWRRLLTGWKTYAGAGIAAGGAVLRYYGMGEEAELLMVVGGALGLVGVGHKLERGVSVGFTKTFGLLLACCLAVSLTACASKSAWTPPAECDGGASIILERIPAPREASLVLQIANLQLLRQHAYGIEDAQAVIDRIERYMEEGVTYLDLGMYVLSRVAELNVKYSAEVFLISQYMGVASDQIPISPCDKALIRAHLERQRQVLLMLGGQ